MATEKRLICREDLLAEYDRVHIGEPGKARKLIANAKAVDAVPVVRCKDCKHFNMQRMECENEYISTDNEGGASYSINFYLDDFCSYGCRKDGDGNG